MLLFPYVLPSPPLSPCPLVYSLCLFVPSVQFSSVTQSCPTLSNPMDCSMPGFPVLYHLLECAQTYVHWIGDAIQPSQPLSSPSPAFNLSQYQGFSSESPLPIRWPKYWSFIFSISLPNEYSELISFRIDRFDLLAVQGLSRVFSSTTVQKYQFFSAQPSLWSSSHICTRQPGKPSLWLDGPLSEK